MYQVQWKEELCIKKLFPWISVEIFPVPWHPLCKKRNCQCKLVKNSEGNTNVVTVILCLQEIYLKQICSFQICVHFCLQTTVLYTHFVVTSCLFFSLPKTHVDNLLVQQRNCSKLSINWDDAEPIENRQVRLHIIFLALNVTYCSLHP